MKAKTAVKKPNIFVRMGRKIKEVFSELKKVTWPTFGKVMKATGTVILIVVLFLIVITAVNYGLSELLQEYFRGDGSLYESYYSFCNQVIKPMRGIVRSMLQGGEPLPAAQQPLPRSLVQAERDDVVRSSLPDERKVDALLLLNEISARAEGTHPQALAASLCGYLYFCAGCGRKNERIESMRVALASIKEGL